MTMHSYLPPAQKPPTPAVLDHDLRVVNINGVTLSGARSDMVSILALFMGRSKANAWMDDLESLIMTKAKAGAEQAIPKIRTAVEVAARDAASDGAKKALTPLLVGAIAVGSLGIILSTVALIRARK